MNRRDFLKRAGAGSIALASLPALPQIASAGRGARRFVFVSVSTAGTDADGVNHFIVMNGCGTFRAGKREAEGGGSFVHWDAAPEGTPKPILAQGRWEVTRFVSWESNDSYGGINSGILEARIRAFPEGADPVRAKLRLVCNVGPGGLTTGEHEGYVLEVPSFGLTFEQLDPEVGLTTITVPGG